MAKQFLKECKETRDAFVKVAGTYNISDNLELRTEIDSLLIMYDQLCERVRLANADTGENNALLPDVSGSFDSLIDRLERASNIKYPNRQWTALFKSEQKMNWKGKEKLLLERVERLESELYER